MKMKNVLLTALLFLALSALVSAQGPYKFSAQKSLIPKDLGKVYLGMTLKEFADEVALGKAVVISHRFDWLELEVPVRGKDVESVRIRVHGLSQEEKARMLVSETATGGDEDDEVDRILVSRIPPHGLVYSMYVKFRPDFDLKSYVLKTYGNGEVRKDDDEYHFYDMQWTKSSPDGLDWLIRSFHLGEIRELQLLGRIAGTEWDAS